MLELLITVHRSSPKDHMGSGKAYCFAVVRCCITFFGDLYPFCWWPAPCHPGIDGDWCHRAIEQFRLTSTVLFFCNMVLFRRQNTTILAREKYNACNRDRCYGS